MWLDNASEIDMLFYEPYANMISNIAKNKKYNPVTIGIFGLWGAGKSTLLKLIEKNIRETQDVKEKIVCVQINAWMFEGYEDAKVALMEALLSELDSEEHKDLFTSVKTEIKSLFKRINYFKLGTDLIKRGIPLATSVAIGNPVPMLLNVSNDKDDVKLAVKSVMEELQSAKKNYIKEKEETTVENIRRFKDDFEKMLESAQIDNVVVLVDDLDRCTPEHIVETLEAIKLFLSVKRTTFILAADEKVIEYAIKKKYPRLEGSQVVLSDEYIEKIIQLPITIPDLSSKDIENYLLLLVAQMYLKEDVFSEVLNDIREKKLAIRESGITLNELNEIIQNSSSQPFEESEIEYKKDSEMIDEIKGIVSTNLKGNPRQTKRFLNTFVTKKELAQMYFGDDIDMKVLTKLLALQKISNDLFVELNEWNKEFVTCNEKFKEMYESVITNGVNDEKYSQWMTPALTKWLKCEPVKLHNIRLDKYFYLTRENIRTSIMAINDLLPETKSVLEAIGNSSEGTIEPLVEELNTKSPQVIDETITMLLSQFNEEKIGMYVIKTIFLKCVSYRGKIIETIKNYPAKFELKDVPYFKTMLGMETDKIQDMLDTIKGNSLPQNLYNKIVSKRGGR